MAIQPAVPSAHAGRLQARGVTIGYEERVVAADLDLTVPDGSFTVVIGPNACGKSTLLKALARLIRPRTGSVWLDGQAISAYSTKHVARELGLLPQSSLVPGGITVGDLVARGRYPHQSMLRQWSPHDQQVVAAAMARTGVSELAHRVVDELSGGQRQRVWLAMVLAQETSILLLDEPTTFLDIAHQVEVLNLCADLHEQGSTLAVVLHDINQACRYATNLVVMRDGRIVAHGDPSDIVTEALIAEVFGLDCRIIPDPEVGTPIVVPVARPGDPRRRTAGN
ncbi:ABC transporter ATP-binding protein [Dactylosporangium sp. NPDC005555]|uniref:ABC transporter ATP-binding protein n=1 Tax=Dactylosporangium sp. NPDC005555 TaxID=3154889 RepID=UPI0033AB12E1